MMARSRSCTAFSSHANAQIHLAHPTRANPGQNRVMCNLRVGGYRFAHRLILRRVSRLF